MGNLGSVGDEHEINRILDDSRFDERRAKEIVAHYKKITKDKEGKIKKDEFYDLLGMERSLFIDRIFDIFDADKSGTVDVQEFANGISAILYDSKPQQRLKFSFRIYDIDGDGYISKTELSKLLSATYVDHLSEKDLEREVNEWFKRADKNNDGKMSFEEFKSLIGENPLLISDVTTQKKNAESKQTLDILSLPLIGRKPAVIVLGTGDVGKSTLCKVIKKYATAEGVTKKDFVTNVVSQNIIVWMKQIIEVADKQNLPIKNRDAARRVLEQRGINDIDIKPWTEQIVNDVRELFEDPTVKSIYEKGNQYQIAETLKYFVYNLDRIGCNDYEPTFADLMRVKTKTTGVITTSVSVEGREVVVVDTGGQVNERRKWYHCYENNVTVVYVASLIAYSLEMYEDYKTNRFEDCLQCFKSCVNDPRLRGSHFVLVLNKKDLLPRALRQKAFRSVVPSYTGREEGNDVINYIKAQYQKQIDEKSEIELTIKVSSLFDTEATVKLYEEIIDVAVHNKHRQDMVGWKDLFQK